AFPLVFFAGVLAGFFGVGGGALQVPVLIMLLGVPVEIATATSALMIVVSALTGAMTHIQLGNVAYEFIPFIIVSVVVGAQIGVQIQRRTGPRTLRRLFALFLVVIGLRMILVLV
ncbi:sulfite exporter TauE/SafE family protein, partial [Candidatus Bathyarchaeota archaeon]|nr:sulfite exporter TauE/SafE family protein [Candidatus Bathyarchaeota archaeon]